MAVEKYKNSPEDHKPLPANEASEFACVVFGEGYWACPKSCQNLISGIYLDPAEVTLRCAIVNSTIQNYTHPEMIDFGVGIRQPGEKPFSPLQLFEKDDKMGK